MSAIDYRLINATSELVAFCDQARENRVVVLDTEFVRTRTFYARLGLVQLQTGAQLVLVDPLREGIDLAPLWTLLRQPEVLTVLHAGGEDIELIHHLAGALPAQVFDTQIAWSFLRDGQQIGYANMVQEQCGVELDKSQSRTDWLKRPLTSQQLDYAAADVHYLAKIYPALYREANESHLADYIAAETLARSQRRSRPVAPDLAWRQIGGVNVLNGQQRAVLQELAAWRQEVAMQQDIALPFMAKDQVLLTIARQQPATREELAGIEGLHPQSLRKHGRPMLAAVARGRARPAEHQPPPLPRLDDHPGYKRMFRAVKKVLQEVAVELGIAPTLLGSRKQINEVFFWYWHTDPVLRERLPEPELLTGWRGPLLERKVTHIILTSEQE